MAGRSVVDGALERCRPWPASTAVDAARQLRSGHPPLGELAGVLVTGGTLSTGGSVVAGPVLVVVVVGGEVVGVGLVGTVVQPVGASGTAT